MFYSHGKLSFHWNEHPVLFVLSCEMYSDMSVQWIKLTVIKFWGVERQWRYLNSPLILKTASFGHFMVLDHVFLVISAIEKDVLQ